MNKAIELGVSYALEGGADGVIVPWPGTQSFNTIQGMCNGLPVWVRPGNLASDNPEMIEALQLGACGLWLDERIFAAADPVAVLKAFNVLVHAGGRVI
jgi:DhnA family fructose-bisphosphate aldolase class Ia